MSTKCWSSAWAYRPIFFRGAVGNLPDCQKNCPTSFLTLLLIVVIPIDLIPIDFRCPTRSTVLYLYKRYNNYLPDFEADIARLALFGQRIGGATTLPPTAPPPSPPGTPMVKWIHRWGAPLKILSDQGKEFNNKV